MDQQTFDRLTRFVGAAGSRRSAWRALLAAALLGATTRTAAAAPSYTGKNPRWRCGEESKCPPGKCFVDECGHELCCTGPKLIICGDRCCQSVGASPCSAQNRQDACIRPVGH